MRIIGPYRILMFIIVYLTTLVLLRTKPQVKGFVVGWASPQWDYTAFYNAAEHAIGVETPWQESAWSPDDWKARLFLIRAYVDLLDQVTEAYIESRLGAFAEGLEDDEDSGEDDSRKDG